MRHLLLAYMLGFTFVTPMVIQAISNDLSKNLTEAYSRLLNRPEMNVDYELKGPNSIINVVPDTTFAFKPEINE